VRRWSSPPAWRASGGARGEAGPGDVTPVDRLFGAHISVRDLQRSLRFYREVVGLELGMQAAPSAHGMGEAVLWAGGRGRSILGLVSLGSAWPLTIIQHHVAFEVSEADLLAVPGALRAAGLAPMDGDREPLSEPVVFTWMPAASVFFDDPDGNLLEYIALLEEPPQPELGLLLKWSEWQSRKRR